MDPASIADEIESMLADTGTDTDAHADVSTCSTEVHAGAGASAGAGEEQGQGQIFNALPAVPMSSTGADNKLRCIRATITGSGVTKGYKQSSFARDVSCGNLRCLKCNFSIRIFNDCKWELTADGSDYLFLRNSFPNDAKLSAKLVSSVGSCAYCCQCSWANSAEGGVEEDASEKQLQWNCSGHVNS